MSRREADSGADARLRAIFARLRSELLAAHRAHRKVALLGQPGGGKSTLLDLVTDRGCVPRPVIGQRTDASEWSRWEEGPQGPPVLRYRDFAFVDAPGYDTLAHPAAVFAEAFPFDVFDRILLVLGGKVRAADDRIWRALRQRSLTAKTLVARGFAESLTEEERAAVSAELSGRFDGRFVLFSNRERTGLAEIGRFVGLTGENR